MRGDLHERILIQPKRIQTHITLTQTVLTNCPNTAQVMTKLHSCPSRHVPLENQREILLPPVKNVTSSNISPTHHETLKFPCHITRPQPKTLQQPHGCRRSQCCYSDHDIIGFAQGTPRGKCNGFSSTEAVMRRTIVSKRHYPLCPSQTGTHLKPYSNTTSPPWICKTSHPHCPKPIS